MTGRRTGPSDAPEDPPSDPLTGSSVDGPVGFEGPAGDGAGVPVEPDGAGGAECGQTGQPAGVAPGGDDLVRAE